MRSAIVGVRSVLGLSLLLALLTHPASAEEGSKEDEFARSLCGSIAAATGAAPADGRPFFVASYRGGPDELEAPLELRSSAFVYDNAVAAVALVACGDIERARRVGDAFLHVATTDRTFQDGRMRNAYRAGPVLPAQKALLPGWWDAKARLWAEDAYQDGTSSGNLAWAALALLNLYDATSDPRYLNGAGSLLRWIDTNTRSLDGIGFTGGLDGFDQAQVKLTWASTEHNVDIAAAADWYGRTSRAAWASRMSQSARAFVERSFHSGQGCFVLGTTPQGLAADTSHLALDTQLWPLLLNGAPPAWQAALGCAEQRLGVEGGFDFDNDRDGVWVEGTAQAALVYRFVRKRERSYQLVGTLKQAVSPSGWLFATQGKQLTTGLMIGPQSTFADFFYYRRPHLAATAWAILAAKGWNPFTGKQAG